MAKYNQAREPKGKPTLFLGPFQPELEEAFFLWVREKKEKDPFAPLVVLVGSNLLGLYLRRLLTQRGLNHINLRFLTFIDLARTLAAEPLDRKGLRPLPRYGDLVLISALAEKIQEGSYFGPIAGRRGFQRALAATFRDLADGGVETLPLLETRKISDLNPLYQNYRSLAGKGFYSSSELFSHGEKEAQRFPQIFGSEELAVYGFYDFTESQKRLLEACIRHLRLTSFMPWRETQGFAYAAPVLQWYRSREFQVQSVARPELAGSKLVEVAPREIFAERPKAFSTREDRTVRIIAAPSEAQEVREIAREVLRLAREEEIPFHEMAVLLRNFDLYAPLLQETFQNLQVPIHLHGGKPLSRTQAGKSVLLLLDLVGGNLRRGEVIEFLTFAPLAWERFFPEEPSTSHWDLISREAGIVEGREEWEERLTSWIAQQEQQEDEEGDQTLIQEAERFHGFLKDFFPALDQFPRNSTWQGMVKACLLLLESYFEANGDREEIGDALRSLVSLDLLGLEVEVRQFKEVLSEALEEKTLAHGAFQRGGVCVSDLMPARGLSFRAVFIPGLVERSFPASPRQDPLLLDAERQAMNRDLKEKGHLPLKRYRFAEEKLLFTLALGAAREKVILSYPRLDPSTGRERIPSFFLLRVGEVLCGEAMDYSRLERIPQYGCVPLSRLAPEDSAEAIDEGEFDLSQVGKALRTHDRREVSYFRRAFPFFNRAEKLARLRWGFQAFTEYDGCMKSARARKLLRERFALSGQVLSATKLETYAACPFNYFLAEVLGLRPLPSPEEVRRIQPLERGTLVHEILFRFYEASSKRYPGPLRSENLEGYWKALEEAASISFAAAEAEGWTGYPLLWEIDRQSILEDLRAFLEKETQAEEGMIPSLFEVRFGHGGLSPRKGGVDEPIPLMLEDGMGFFLRGRMDRVDFSPERDALRVIDYKTGKLQGEEDGFCGGTTLQLPLYLMAACRTWKEADLEKSWAEYCSVSRKGKFARIPFRGDGWEEKEANLKKILETIFQGISEGTFFPYREKSQGCSFCDFRNLCEHGVDVLFEKKKKDPRAAAFLEIRQIP
ncbi:MAG TPA: PD-(D/E)XK nuclease family protein [Thermodesulfobacteriota bacterium]|nr:PD-(D/E)XK nuclease family protein [Thermodesulfobacteriota bacterium]